MSNISISVENIWKKYRYGTVSHDTLRKDLQSCWARFRGREDLNAPVDLSGSSQHGHHSSSDYFWALRGVSFEAHQGEIVGIIGRNGAGKSTLLKMLSRVSSPTKGTIKIRGRIAGLLEVGTGFHPELTGRENIFLNGAILGMTKNEIKGNLEEIVAFAEISAFVDTPVKRYSSGMYLRLAFAVAAHLEAEIMLVDEVLAVGDALFQRKCLEKICAVTLKGRTVLLVSHNMTTIESICQRVLFLDNGSIISDGSAPDLVRRYLSGKVPVVV